MNNELETEKYEVVYVLDPSYEERQAEKEERLQSIIEAEGGQVEGKDEWGKLRTAYEIEDNREGLYVLFNFNCPTDRVDEIAERSNVEEGVMRYQIVRREEE